MSTFHPAILRIARPTDDLERLLGFYRDALGFEVLGEFADHEGFDGVMLGTPGLPYHLEFTRRHGHPAGGAPSDEHLLVFYLEDLVAWQSAVDRLLGAGCDPVPAANPYWDRRGKTFEDPDGYRIVICHGTWGGS